MRLPSFRPPPLTARSFFSFSPFPANPCQSYTEQKQLPYAPISCVITFTLQFSQQARFNRYSARQLYRIVSDVQSYPRFVPFCVTSRIIRTIPKLNSKNACNSDVDYPVEMDAELTVGFLSFKESYVSHVSCVPYERVEAVASSSTPLFKSLSTCWRFKPVPSAIGHDSSISTVDSPKTIVTLDLAYEFANPLHAQVSSAFFGQVSKAMVKAFEDRCYECYRRIS